VQDHEQLKRDSKRGKEGSAGVLRKKESLRILFSEGGQTRERVLEERGEDFQKPLEDTGDCSERIKRKDLREEGGGPIKPGKREGNARGGTYPYVTEELGGRSMFQLKGKRAWVSKTKPNRGLGPALFREKEGSDRSEKV